MVILKILVEVSARHVHLCKKDFETLFGKDTCLSIKKELSQPGQYVCEQRIDIVGPKGEIKNVGIIGPERKESQVEISLTDARKLGINAPVRLSGKIEDTPGCKLIGPKGSLVLEKGVIISKRHIHFNDKYNTEKLLKDKQNVKVKVQTKDRSLIFDDVIVRVSDSFNPAFHIDTDEANAAGIDSRTFGEIII